MRPDIFILSRTQLRRIYQAYSVQEMLRIRYTVKQLPLPVQASASLDAASDPSPNLPSNTLYASVLWTLLMKATSFSKRTDLLI